MAKTTKKQTRDSHLTDLEKLGGVILLLIYLALIPLCGAAILNWAGGLLGFSIGPALRQTIWFYLLFAAVALVFHRFLFVCAGTFTGSAGRSFQTLGTALIFFYGLNEILFRVTHLLWGHTINLNDTALVSLDLLNAAPAATVLALVVLAPFIEEVLLRGFLCGWLRQHSRAAAYLFTCVLFALLHTWAMAGDHFTLYYLLIALQYAVPGLIFAWAYDRSDSIWIPIAAHAAVNALAVWTFYA